MRSSFFSSSRKFFLVNALLCPAALAAFDRIYWSRVDAVFYPPPPPAVIGSPGQRVEIWTEDTADEEERREIESLVARKVRVLEGYDREVEERRREEEGSSGLEVREEEERFLREVEE